MPVDVLRVADRVAGDAIERLTNDHHSRRLSKLGRSAQRTPPDDGHLRAAGDPPPRAGNALDVLIEGRFTSRRSRRRSDALGAVS
jgi:hypothetical protein